MDFRAPASIREAVFLVACAALLLGGHLMFGALTGEASAAIAGAWSLLALIGAFSLARLDNRMTWPLAVAAGGFTIVLAFAAASLTDIIPGTAQPIWAQLGLDPAATLDRSETRLEMVKLCGLGMTFLVGWGLGASDATALRAFKAACYSAALFAAIAIIMDLGHIGPKTQAGRLEATFLNPNTAGALFGAALCLCVGQALRTFRQAGQKLGRVSFAGAVLGCILTFTALILTFSRGAMAATAVALFAMMVLRAFARRWTFRQLGLGLGAFAAGAALLLALNGQFYSRLSMLRGDSLLRRYIFDSHWQAFTEAPLLGYGLGGFDTVNRMRLTVESYAWLWNIRSAENVYLQWLVEGGLLIAIPMFATLGFVIFRTAFQTVRRRAMLGPLHALLAVDMVFLLHGVVDFALQTYSVAVFWSFLLGLQLAWSGSSFRRGIGQ